MLPFTLLNSGLLPIRRAVSRALKSQFPRLNYAVWAWRNPGKTFKAYYVETVVPALEGRKRHASLGPVLKPGRNAKALRKFNQLIALGISPTDTLVDYGCGTLRVGRSFIEFLEADRYIGMDIDNRILDAGRRSLPAELIAFKRPVLEVISRESLIRVAAQRPRWIIAKGVLQHVPPGELNEFFESLAYLVHAGSEAFLFARCAKESTTRSSKTWLHTFDRLQEAAERNSMELDRPDKRRNFLKLRSNSREEMSRGLLC